MSSAQASPGGVSGTEYFSAFLAGDQEVPPVSSEATGAAAFSLDDGATLNYSLAATNIISVTGVHIHQGAVGVNGPIVFTLCCEAGSTVRHSPNGTLMLTEQQANELRAGSYYVNIHTEAHPPGEIRGQINDASTTTYQTVLSGANEVPAEDGSATGQAYITLAPDMTQLYYRVYVAGIEGITAAHIHRALPGQNGPAIFTLHDGSGIFDPQNPLNGSWSPTILQVAQLLAGDYYVNVHTGANPAGEIRGQIASFTPPAESHALLAGVQEVPAVDTDAVGVGRFELSDDLGMVSYTIAVSNILNIDAAHLHAGQPGQNGGVAHTLYGGGGSFGPGSPLNDAQIFDAQSVLDYMSGNYYVNIHTTGTPSGEIRGQIVSTNVFSATLSGKQEVPPVSTDASGNAILAFNDNATKLYYRMLVEDIPEITAAHIHQAPPGSNGPVAHTLYGGSGDFDEENPTSGVLDLTNENIFTMLSGDYYINVHTVSNPPDEIRGQIGAHVPPALFKAELSGDQEVPPISSLASGQGDFTLDRIRNTLHYYLTVNDIVDITAAHIHVGPAGQNGPVAYGLYSGDGMFDPDHPIGSGLGLSGENLVDLLTGYYYVNVHTQDHPAGEIRGQIGPVAVLPQKQIFLPTVLKN